jgi:putative Mg2+ transporter-C (MgtC) family protein
MSPFSFENLLVYWSSPELGASIVVLMNLIGALFLGCLVGYERSYRSRAAGMRTLGLVCVASTALTVICGYPHLWYAGHFSTIQVDGTTRVIQGIVTGVGFIGGGVIMKDGTQISGLTTAATIWVVAAIGILLGVGLYPAAIVLALGATAFNMWGAKIEVRLPLQSAINVTIKFKPDALITQDELRNFLGGYGYIMARDSISITIQDEIQEWRFVAIGQDKRRASNIPAIASQIRALPGISHIQLSYVRN